jgi:dolichol-phosphate mannosyltransferase
MRLSRFLLVGGLGAIVQLSLFTLLARFGLPPVEASVISVEAAVLHNFCWHQRFTWRDREVTTPRQNAIRLFRFHLSNGMVSLIGNAALTYWLVNRLGFPPVPSTIAAIVICSALNFALADRWVYRETSRALL